eukprot:TRINITY_DN67301_c7_g1_i1.p1 TRINITY_DN67301_c7_g1~~TRINITY_DN67301_c7_g1_i1.p1  ORF type:complete len:286 (+),score=36.95 TRINITY_DN67301_c7_g1_i1:54-911(+)
MFMVFTHTCKGVQQATLLPTLQTTILGTAQPTITLRDSGGITYAEVRPDTVSLHSRFEPAWQEFADRNSALEKLNSHDKQEQQVQVHKRDTVANNKQEERPTDGENHDKDGLHTHAAGGQDGEKDAQLHTTLLLTHLQADEELLRLRHVVVPWFSTWLTICADMLSTVPKTQTSHPNNMGGASEGEQPGQHGDHPHGEMLSELQQHLTSQSEQLLNVNETLTNRLEAVRKLKQAHLDALASNQPPTPTDTSLVEQLQQKNAELEAENAQLQAKNVELHHQLGQST